MRRLLFLSLIFVTSHVLEAIVSQKGLLRDQESYKAEKLTYYVGQYAQGGIVCYVDETGQHGLVCSIKNMRFNRSENIYFQTKFFGPLRGFIGTCSPSGKENLLRVETFCQNSGGIYLLSDFPAFYACKNYTTTMDGIEYNDWFLPSVNGSKPFEGDDVYQERNELHYIYSNQDSINATLNTVPDADLLQPTDRFLSSYEINSSHVWVQFFSYFQSFGNKGNAFKVRAMRAF